jgi:hypothetical protein
MTDSSFPFRQAGMVGKRGRVQWTEDTPREGTLVFFRLYTEEEIDCARRQADLIMGKLRVK